MLSVNLHFWMTGDVEPSIRHVQAFGEGSPGPLSYIWILVPCHMDSSQGFSLMLGVVFSSCLLFLSLEEAFLFGVIPLTYFCLAACVLGVIFKESAKIKYGPLFLGCLAVVLQFQFLHLSL